MRSLVIQVVKVSNGYIITSASGVPISVAPEDASPHELGVALKFGFNQLERATSHVDIRETNRDDATGELPSSAAASSAGGIPEGAGG